MRKANKGMPIHGFKKRMTATIFILAILLATAIAGLRFRMLKTQILTTNIQAMPTVTPYPSVYIVNTFPEETKNWEIYINEYFGISIHYPQDIVIKKSEKDVVWFAKANDAQKDFRSINLLQIYFRGEEGANPEEALKRECGTPCNGTYVPAVVNNAHGFKATNSLNTNNYSGSCWLSDEADTWPTSCCHTQ
jgi:hypothetical protein